MPRTTLEPVATYRVQLTPDFTFAEVTGILGHLCDLGVSHLYLSPILEAMPGSQHGYDWSPPARIAQALGGLDGFRFLREHARALGIGMILDLVPNHVGVASVAHNPWWEHVLTFGFDSPYATYFDLYPADTDTIYLPYLGRAEDLADLRLDERDWLVLGDIAVPTAPGTVAPGDDPLEVHQRQHYRLVAHDGTQIGYRRFLTVNGLAALRQEIPAVYDATHGWLQELVADDLLDGVRIDHLDGLRDPVGYLTRLRADLGADRLIYVEKTLAIAEELDPSLPVDGTTGYETLQLIEARFTAPTGAIELEETFRTISGGREGDGDRLWERARELRESVLVSSFPDRLQRITDLLSARDHQVPPHILRQAVSLLVSSSPVARPGYPATTEAVLNRIDNLAAENLVAAPGCEVLATAIADPDYAPEAVARLGEATVAVYGQAIEGIGYNRTARLVSSQELGCSPLIPAINQPDFDERCSWRAAHWPRGLNALSTHDTKRAEDVRARIAVIAQTPQRWRIFVDELWRMAPPPHSWVCYYLLQNLVGVWPDQALPDEQMRARFSAFASKTLREGQVVSSWSDPNPRAEADVLRWLDTIQTGIPGLAVSSFVSLIADAGREESLSRKVISLTLPGVGDIYQGTQWWDDSLTDPDNRRPVDYTRSLDHPKVQAVRAALAVRRRHLDSFGPGSDYASLTVRGPAAAHLIAFSRGHRGVAAVVVVGVRLALMFNSPVTRGKAYVELPPGIWVETTAGEEFTGSISADALLADKPYALLELKS
ncbi:malto-oligosyltrehalose synthase [Gordonia sp. (in: high G+C Gram-positive bacteria)]|uniref:malto-oligosyltrehalose synthase n=1 Tax=Gordonia sp. (in: high G+C Gram-positive bacteria) TaxID=84139 RepID=UPI003C76BDFD